MCGISGIFNYGDAQPVDGVALRRMAHSLAHRGPDDAGYLEDGPCGFGFRRLSIIDLLTGRQPILSEDGARAVILNGEIYNYVELRSGLRDRGRRFLTNSDTEVILAAYEHQGVECPTWLRGMFAFAVWDRDHRRLLLGRDRLGVKPLYYLDDGRRLVFGSEIKAILAAGDVSREIDLESVADYFALRGLGCGSSATSRCSRSRSSATRGSIIRSPPGWRSTRRSSSHRDSNLRASEKRASIADERINRDILRCHCGISTTERISS